MTPWLITGVLLGTCVIRLFIIEAKLDRLLRAANSHQEVE